MKSIQEATKAVVCYSGGYSSALCAVAAVAKFGKENVILLNHDITPKVEDQDIKRFKTEVAELLGLEITFANHKNWEVATPVQVCIDAKAWKVGRGKALCTNRLKTEPFDRWRADNDQDRNYVYVYGFDNTPAERSRATRRANHLGSEGYMTWFPLISGDADLNALIESNIDRPMGYAHFVHANCVGCLKAGWQHWYIVYCTRPDIWEEAKRGEEIIGYAIHWRDGAPEYLEDREEFFEKMKRAGIKPTEHIKYQSFWAKARKAVKDQDLLEEMERMSEDDNGVCLDCMG